MWNDGSNRDSRNNWHGGAHRRPQGGPGGHGRWRGGGQRQGDRGTKTCPKCGAVVTDLGGHIRSRHDDPASHPRE
jgi:hypothetical protein